MLKNVGDVMFSELQSSPNSDQSGITMAKQSQQNAKNFVIPTFLRLFHHIFSSFLIFIFLSTPSLHSSVFLYFLRIFGKITPLHPVLPQRDRAVLSVVSMFETSMFDVRSTAPFAVQRSVVNQSCKFIHTLWSSRLSRLLLLFSFPAIIVRWCSSLVRVLKVLFKEKNQRHPYLCCFVKEGKGLNHWIGGKGRERNIYHRSISSRSPTLGIRGLNGTSA